MMMTLVLRITGVVLAVEGWRHPFSAWVEQSWRELAVHRNMTWCHIHSLQQKLITIITSWHASIRTIMILYIFLLSKNAVTSETSWW